MRPVRATAGATEVLPDDPQLAIVIDAWSDLPDAVKSTILMLVKASQAEART
jgi:hypothetical protein